MNAIVFGASGSVGIEVVKQAMQKQIKTTAFVRNPEKFPLSENEYLKIVKGDVLNVPDIEDALKNQDVVICTLGDGKIGKIRGIGTANIIKAMKNLGVKKIICQSTIGAGRSYGNLNFLWKYIMFGFLLKRVLPDHEEQEKHLNNSNLNYIIVRPGALTKGFVTNKYKIGFAENLKNLSLKINRADVADFMLQQINESKFIRKAVSISN